MRLSTSYAPASVNLSTDSSAYRAARSAHCSASSIRPCRNRLSA